MHDRIESNPKYLCEFIETNSMMTNNYFESLINYLDLDIMDDNEYLLFTDKIFKKNWKKCYKK